MTITPNVTPHVASTYEPGAILEHSWGYDQTNIDFFVIVKRAETPSGQVWLTLVEMTQANKTETGFMTGNTEPGTIDPNAKPIRRKLRHWEDQERGVPIHRGYGWASLWDGKPARWSSYA